MIRILSFLFLFLLAFCSKAEKINGIVFDKNGNKPISFVSIGIINSPFGTYSNENGHFELTLEHYNENDSLRFSCIGFNSISYKFSEFLDRFESGDTIYLIEKITVLDEVVISGKRIKTKVLGNKNASRQVLIGFLGDKESGIVIENEKNILLKNVAFKLAMTQYDHPDSAVFRFNIYSLKNGLPERNLLIKPIYFRIYKGQFDKTVSFNIRSENIKLEESFAATFELVKQYGGKRIYFAGKIHGCKGINRWGPQGEWTEQKADGGPLKLHQSLEIEVLEIE
jgi:hypothetical protein